MMSDVIYYTVQMIPLGFAALLVFLLLRPWRKGRLDRLGLSSGPRRELALLLFSAYCAGLAALTLFPANYWGYVFDRLFRGEEYFRWAWGNWTLTDFYPSWEETLVRVPGLPNMLTPFQEIRRALKHKSYWLMFMLLGNFIMFMPLGFFPALLWRDWRWWRSLLTGFCTSAAIEFVQFFIGRSTDIDDVILNTAGALAGYWVFWLLRLLFPKFTEKFQCRPRGGYYCG